MNSLVVNLYHARYNNSMSFNKFFVPGITDINLVEKKDFFKIQSYKKVIYFPHQRFCSIHYRELKLLLNFQISKTNLELDVNRGLVDEDDPFDS